MADVTMQVSTAEARPLRARPRAIAGRLPEERLPLPTALMLIVLASAGCWFVLASLVRWMFF